MAMKLLTENEIDAREVRNGDWIEIKHEYPAEGPCSNPYFKTWEGQVAGCNRKVAILMDLDTEEHTGHIPMVSSDEYKAWVYKRVKDTGQDDED